MYKYKIFVCTHIPIENRDPKLYEILQTGRKYDNKVIENSIGDDTGVNISHLKNEYDGLLTGMFWIWKNTCYDVVGLCGYRSYFGLNRNTIMTIDDAKELFEEKGYDMIMFRIRFNNMSVEEHFRWASEDAYYRYLYDPIIELRAVIMDHFISYLNAFDFVMSGSIMNHRNMFVAKKEYFDAYCTWLFDVIHAYKKRLMSIRYPIPPRFFGFIAELLQRVWVMNNHLYVRELPIVWVSDRNTG